MLLREIKNIFHSELDTIYPKAEVASFFYVLVEHYLGLARFAMALDPKIIISKEQEQPFFEALAGLKLERPIQYIIGETSFMDLQFKVNEKVLIPRPETEELVRWIISEFNIQHSALRILDIGTGSGCIAIALAKYLAGAKVYALDTSDEIIDVAKFNAVLNNVKIVFSTGDIFAPKEFDEKFDIIVSNPPYVREMEREQMNKNVKEYEPSAALFVSDREPLQFYERIVSFAVKNLKRAGALYLEINQYLSEETKDLLEDQDFSEIQLRKDMFGNYRMLKGSS